MDTKQHTTKIATQIPCYHCGVKCRRGQYAKAEKSFCCEGCLLVYEILDNNGLCNYYEIQDHPGISQIVPIRKEKYSYLDNEAIAQKLYRFTDGDNTMVQLYIPGIHCNSCMWLLEHLPKINAGITQSRMNFSAKELTVYFKKSTISLRQIVELLSTLGYEPYLSLDEASEKKVTRQGQKQLILRLGVAGFCFGNIMMLSFPDYLSGEKGVGALLEGLFQVLSVLLALPVFFYCAQPFFKNAWNGLKQRNLNIDIPIALAIVITFVRSLIDLSTQAGPGFLDSMSGIVFFMLVGRVVQDRTYRSISFHRDYKSYFPIAVHVMQDGKLCTKSLHDLQTNDEVWLHNEEIIPADGLLIKGEGRVDYSFVTGESEPVPIAEGSMVYAGGKQVGSRIVVKITKPVAGSYLTSLWNHSAFSKDKSASDLRNHSMHWLSKYFTLGVLLIALITSIYWAYTDTAKIWPAVTAILIVACPCALLLTVSFTHGSLLRLFTLNGLFLRDALVIEPLAKINHIVFDKTGTITNGHTAQPTGNCLPTSLEQQIIHAATAPSVHPYSKALHHYTQGVPLAEVSFWKEVKGNGIEAEVEGYKVIIGSASFVGIEPKDMAAVYTRFAGGRTIGFAMQPKLREGVATALQSLKQKYNLELLSGDNEHQRPMMQQLFGIDVALHFNQQPMDKLEHIKQMQEHGAKVIMIGDGLNDAGALQQSNVGITLTDDINNFTPACDAILKAEEVHKLPKLLQLSVAAKRIIWLAFAISIGYNLVGLFFSVQGVLSPLIAAVLMPLSTLSIVLITAGASNIYAKAIGLRTKSLPYEEMATLKQ